MLQTKECGPGICFRQCIKRYNDEVLRIVWHSVSMTLFISKTFSSVTGLDWHHFSMFYFRYVILKQFFMITSPKWQSTTLFQVFYGNSVWLCASFFLCLASTRLNAWFMCLRAKHLPASSAILVSNLLICTPRKRAMAYSLTFRFHDNGWSLNMAHKRSKFACIVFCRYQIPSQSLGSEINSLESYNAALKGGFPLFNCRFSCRHLDSLFEWGKKWGIRNFNS